MAPTMLWEHRTLMRKHPDRKSWLQWKNTTHFSPAHPPRFCGQHGYHACICAMSLHVGYIPCRTVLICCFQLVYSQGKACHTCSQSATHKYGLSELPAESALREDKKRTSYESVERTYTRACE